MSDSENGTRRDELAAFVEATAKEYGIPGACVGVLTNGQETCVSYGVTNLDHPQPVDDDTLFHLASVTKTFTATALMRLVAEGRVELDAPVRRYVPELRLADEAAAERITVLNLLNHTAGLDWNLVPSGDEADTLAGFVAHLPGLPLIAPPGSRASYSQAGYNVVGRIIETVTGLPFEKAMDQLLLEPAGLTNTFFDLDEVMVRRFVVGHTPDDGGEELRPARPWASWRAGARGNNPGGGIASSVSDLLRWARFQLGRGDRVLPAEALRRMTERTVELRASTLGDGLGIGWFLREVDGLRTIGHGGSGNGQSAELLIVPERDFAVVSLANAGAHGHLFNRAVVRWVLERYLGAVERDPEPVAYDTARAREVAGRYAIDAMNLDVADDGARLVLAVRIKPEIRAAADTDMPADHPAATIGLLSGTGDEYIVTEGGLKGQRGVFRRDAQGTVVGIDLAGRLFQRAPAAS
ncbi:MULTISPECIES: serine hydrolase domain-containing protein [unclassified Streptomyces]|uniref:serine hydrolase domain-containing protein n=1 Tax=unclassified Streptomyces TaxID=2593676 RepID=UPI002E285B25|nr:serine hydrolase domain-containing protein [Streptomyces sp. NBC_01439]